MSIAYVVLPVLLIVCRGTNAQSAAKWMYSSPATTFDGRLCLTDCKEDTCIVDWEGTRKGCKKDPLYFAPQYKYRTVQEKDKTNNYCLSNCGYFGFEFEWCVTSEDKKWDYCNSGDQHVSVYKKPCKEYCDKYGETYYWCFVEGGSWQYCAPPRET